MQFKKLHLLTFAILGSLAVSCNNGNNTENYTSIGTSVASTTNGWNNFKLDSGPLVNPVNLRSTGSLGKRILINYYDTENQTNLNGADKNVYITSFTWILTKNVIKLTAANQNEIGNDPFYELYDINIANGFLNTSVSVLFDQVPHYINLVDNTINGEQIIADTVNLELRQNGFGYNSGVPLLGIVSFDLSPYKAIAENMNKTGFVFKVKVNFFNGSRYYKIKYDFTTPQNEFQFLNMSTAIKENIFK